VLKGHRELLVQPTTSTTPGAPPLRHDCSLTRLHLQLGIHLQLQPLCLHTCVKSGKDFKKLLLHCKAQNIKRIVTPCVKTACEGKAREGTTTSFNIWERPRCSSGKFQNHNKIKRSKIKVIRSSVLICLTLYLSVEEGTCHGPVVVDEDVQSSKPLSLQIAAESHRGKAFSAGSGQAPRRVRMHLTRTKDQRVNATIAHQ
jgi:hypothetical protein